jgi:hypothetical protein
MKVHMFNTGRQYTQFGQRIAWVPVDDGDWVVFVDVDRCIEGSMRFHTEPTGGQVLRRYDHCDYQSGYCEALKQSDFIDLVHTLRMTVAKAMEAGQLGLTSNDLVLDVEVE